MNNNSTPTKANPNKKAMIESMGIIVKLENGDLHQVALSQRHEIYITNTLPNYFNGKTVKLHPKKITGITLK